VDRLACVEVPALPLQLLLQQQPEWAGWPAAVVDEDKPQGLVLYVNGKARDAGVLPGHRYGPALALSPHLRAGTITDAAIAEGVKRLLARLHNYSPEVEPSAREPGVFWLDAGGFQHLYASCEAWGLALRADLQTAGFIAGVVIGFRRFGTYATAKAVRGRRVLVFESAEDEDAATRNVPLAMVGLPPGVRDTLAKLGISNVGELVGLPAHGVKKRFGDEALQLHRFASGDLELPLNPTPPEKIFEEHLELEYGETNAERLVFTIKPLVDRLLLVHGQRGQALVELQVRLALDGLPERFERIRTAEPTLASVMVMELVKLRLVAAPITAAVTELWVSAATVAATPAQLRIFVEAPKRDMAAAARAFARLRAAFACEDIVVKATLRDRHSPEGSFGWEPLYGIALPQPRPVAAGMLVRRILSKPEVLPHQPRRSPDGWLIRGAEHGPVERLCGPYRLSGGWWKTDVQRDYYFAELQRGELLWIYYDRDQRRWYLHGEIG
jgi:protein ImuB